MKFTRRRGISQSLDLYMIIGVVLAASVAVAASISSLVSSAGQSSTLQLSASSLVGGSAPALSLTVKNVGTTALSSGTITIALDIAGAVGCTDSMSGSITWSGACTGTSAPITWTGTTSLASGAQVSFAVTFSGIVPTITSGSTYSVIVTLGGASTSAKLTAQ